MRIRNETGWRTDDLRKFVVAVLRGWMTSRIRKRYLLVKFVNSKSGRITGSAGASIRMRIPSVNHCRYIFKSFPDHNQLKSDSELPSGDKVRIAWVLRHEALHVGGLSHVEYHSKRYRKYSSLRNGGWDYDDVKKFGELPIRVQEEKKKLAPEDADSKKLARVVKNLRNADRKLKLYGTLRKKYLKQKKYYEQKIADRKQTLAELGDVPPTSSFAEATTQGESE